MTEPLRNQGWNPDPLTVAVEEARHDGYQQGYQRAKTIERHRRRERLAELVAGIVAGIVIGYVLAASRVSASSEPVVGSHPPLAVPSVSVSATPSVELGTAIEAGVASWFASYGPGFYAAVPSYRWGDPRYDVTVCRQDDPSRCVVVVVRDHCACPGDRIVDLSRDAFARLEDPSRGLVAVTVEAGGVSVTLPPTSTDR